jgi:hypothetical protein
VGAHSSAQTVLPRQVVHRRPLWVATHASPTSWARLRACGTETLRHVVRVDDVEQRVNVVAAAALVLEVIRVLEDIEDQQRRDAQAVSFWWFSHSKTISFLVTGSLR